MATPISFDETFILSIWLEVLLYGLYSSLFGTSVYIILQKRNFHAVPNRVMFGSMLVMFFLATIHVAVNLYRMLRGYVWLRDAPGGPAAYFGNLARWDHVFKDSIFTAQSIIGDALIIYRCWIVWDKNYYIIALPFFLLICSSGFGPYVCWLFTTVSNASIFNARLNRFISTFFSIALSQNIITTFLIAYRIWRQDRAVSQLNVGGRSSLTPIIRIMVESAAIYVIDELILIVLYSVNDPAQYIVLETITQVVGIVFALITVRLDLRTRKAQNASSGSTTAGFHAGGAVDLPMYPMAIHITRSIRKDLDEGDGKQSSDGHIPSGHE